jgi:hypothetical protein
VVLGQVFSEYIHCCEYNATSPPYFVHLPLILATLFSSTFLCHFLLIMLHVLKCMQLISPMIRKVKSV